MRLILVGAGHAHLSLCKNASQFIQRGIDITLISPGLFWYSGLATGVLGGRYAKEQDQIDLHAIAKLHGGTAVFDRVKKIKPEEKTLILEKSDPITYDALSVNVGSTLPAESIPGLAENSFQVKPIPNLWKLKETVLQEKRPQKIIVVGGGATGCEIAANLHALKKSNPIQLITSSSRLLSEHFPSVSKKMESLLRDKGVEVVFNQKVIKMDKGMVVTESHSYAADHIVSAIGLVPPVLLDGKRGILVKDTLQSVDYPEIFGAGDCIRIQGYDLPKIGVYGVKEAPILQKNLLAFLAGEPLESYHPQKTFLSILNLGDGTGLAIRKPFYWHGRLSMLVKDWIDRYFLWSLR